MYFRFLMAMVGSAPSAKETPASNSEVEEDLANNNDPNNNAFNSEDNERANNDLNNVSAEIAHLPSDLDQEVQNVLQVLPDSDTGEVERRLKKYWSHQSRIEVS